MIAATAPLHKPTFRFSSSKPSSKRNLSKSSILLEFPASKSGFFGGFGSKRALSKTMTELVKVSASNGDETVRILEEEGFIDGSSNELPAGFMADGLEATLNRLSKWLVAALFGAVLLWRHDAEALWAAMGSVINSILAVTLKRILNQERPVSTLRSDPGMPSSHAQSIFFTVTFVVLSVIEWLGTNVFTLTFGVIALAFGSYFSWLRVSQQLHTISQVVVGAAVGSVFSLLWYWSWKAIVLEAFISSLWVRIVVVLGASAFCLCFLVYVIRYWLNDDR